MHDMTQTVDLTAPEFSHVRNDAGRLCGFLREIPGSYFMDGRQRIAMFDECKVFIGTARSVETGCIRVVEHHRAWRDWVKVPFIKKTDPADPTAVAG